MRSPSLKAIYNDLYTESLQSLQTTRERDRERLMVAFQPNREKERERQVGFAS